MPALESLIKLTSIHVKNLSKQEIIALESELYTLILRNFWKAYKTKHKEYFYLIKSNLEEESHMMEWQVIRYLINDILKSNAYTLAGIARYTETPEEIIQDLVIGHHISPAIAFMRKLIELHKSLHPDVYKNVIKKISDEPDDEDENNK